jgi:hypothetical protein
MSPHLILWLPPLAASVILLAATRRAWRHHRRFQISLGLAVAFAVLVTTLPDLPAPLGALLAPLFALAALWFVFAADAWHYAPDFGQRGFLWLLPRAAAPTLLGALGLLCAQSLWLGTRAPAAFQLPMLFTGSLAALLPLLRTLSVL